MTNLDYIKKFSKITITEACKKCKVSRGNIYNGNVKEEDLKRVKEYLESEVAKLYIKDDGYYEDVRYSNANN